MGTGLPTGSLVLVACSGGADSVALAAAAAHAGVRCAIGHVDHGLRPESGADAEFVRALAERLSLPFFVRRIRDLDLKELGLEAAAREVRYRALTEMAREAGAAAVATAHTRRDQAETVLLRLLRGAGPSALAGVRRGRPLADGIELLRPFLAVSREATEAYCAQRGLPFLNDPHNLDPARARARLRALWPALRELNPRVEEALAGAAELFASEDELLTRLAAVAPQLHPALQRRALVAAAASEGLKPDRKHVEEMLRLLETGGSIDVPGGRATVTFERSRRAANNPLPAVAVRGPGNYAWGPRTLQVEDGPAEGIGVDLAQAPFPWTLRSRRPGDRFRAAGGRTKKVADHFIDAHIPRDVRPALAVLADAAGRLFWVEGLPLSGACSAARGATFRIRPEMKPLNGPLADRRRPESRSATMLQRPDEEPR